MIDSERRPLTFLGIHVQRLERKEEGNWIDDMSDGNNHFVDTVRYAMMNGILGGKILVEDLDSVLLNDACEVVILTFPYTSP